MNDSIKKTLLKLIRIRFYEEGDEKDIFKLFKITFNRKLDENFWFWRYINNPVKMNVIALAYYNNQLISHYAIAPNYLLIQQKKYIGGLSMTTMTHPDFRGLGLFPKLANIVYNKAKQKGIRLIYGFPNSMSYKGFINNLEWNGYGNINLYSQKSDEYKKIPNNSFTSKQIFRIDFSLKDLNKKMSKDFIFTIDRTSNFYNWRYFNNPMSKYFVFCLENGDKKVGLFVLKKFIDNDGKIWGHIVDFLVEDQIYYKDILYHSLKELSKMGIKNTSLWAFEKMAKFLELKKFHFRESCMPRNYFGFKVLDEELKEKFKDENIFKNFYICMGDSDVY